MSSRSPEIFDLIEAYLSNELSAKTKADFEKELIADSELREEVEKHRSMHETMSDIDVLNFRKKLLKAEKEYFEPSMESGKSMAMNWKVAAAILAIIGLSLFGWYQNINQEKSLFEKHFTVYPLEDAVRGGQDESMKVAFEAYSKQDYAKAIPILENLVAKMPDKHDLKMYLGSSYLKSGAVGQAIREFEKLTAIETYSEQAKWYLALCYLKANENDRVTTLLEDIIVFDGIYRNDAKNLYEEILMQSNPDDF